jgi:hypothetical protein
LRSHKPSPPLGGRSVYGNLTRSIAVLAVTCAALCAATAVANAGSVGLKGVEGAAGAPTPIAAPTPTAGATTGEALRSVAISATPLPGRHLSSAHVLAIASRPPAVRAARDRHPGSYGAVFTKGPRRWEVSFLSHAGKEIAQVIVGDGRGRVLEAWVGFQAAWTMARGYRGAFGGHVSALYVWIPLCLLFFIPFFDWRHPLRLLHLDLLAFLSLSVSLAFFNHANIYASVPLVYPPLIYLLARMLALALRRHGRAARTGPLLARRVPLPWMALAVIFLVGFRVALNVTDSNVIDVGYASVMGAEKVGHGERLYGGWPRELAHGDTYGPVNYEAYTPFVALVGFSGHWDDLPAAHTASVVFDLLVVALLFLLGRRIRDSDLGVLLAYGWVSYPFTLYALESNSNDTLVAVFVLGALLLASSPVGRGAMAALAALTKLAPLVLVPILATHGLRGDLQEPRRRAAGRSLGALALFAASFLIVAGLVSLPGLAHDTVREVYTRTVAYQIGRDSPFSIWDLHPTFHWLELPVELLAVALACALALVRRRGDVVGLAAACAAALIAVQIGLEYWFYLYIPWFFAPALVALFGACVVAPREAGSEDSAGGQGSSRGSIESARLDSEQRIRTAISQGSSVALSKRVGIWERKPSIA